MEARRDLAVLMGGFATTQMLYVAARLGLADHLARGPLTVAALAAESGCRQAPLSRILRALSAFGVFQLEAGKVSNTPMSAYLRSGGEDSLREVALLYGEEHYHAMSELLQAVKTGGSAFEHAYRKPHFTYLASNHDAANAYYATTGAASERAARALVKAYDFSRATTVVDVGGGTGALLRRVLQANPHTRGVLVETSGLARKAQARVQADGLAERCEVQPGDIVRSVPRGGDVYLLGHVLHGLDDAHAERLLHACARAMTADARLLIVERLIPDAGAHAAESQFAALSDALSLAVWGGLERTHAEIEALLATADLESARPIGMSSGDTLIVATTAR